MKKSILRECVRIAKEKNTPELHPEWGNFHHYSFIVQKNILVGWSTNRPASRVNAKLLGYRDKTKGHSEYESYSRVKGLLDKRYFFECVNIRLNRFSEFRLSRPCECCNNFLYSAGCSRIFYSVDANHWMTFGEIKI